MDQASPVQRTVGGTILEKEGFLSPDIELWRTKIREANALWCVKIAKVNSIAHRFAFEIALETNDRSASRLLLAMQLFVRALSTFQAAILLVERGLVVEARTLARSCLETIFFLGALNNEDFEIMRIMLYDDFSNRQKLARELKQSSQFGGEAGEELVRRIDALIAHTTPDAPEKINYQVLAGKADMADLYSIYRLLSADAAHPTITSLRRYVEPDSEGKITSIHFGPDVDEAEFSETAWLSCNIIVGACVAFNQIAQNMELDAVLREVHEEIGLTSSGRG